MSALALPERFHAQEYLTAYNEFEAIPLGAAVELKKLLAVAWKEPNYSLEDMLDEFTSCTFDRFVLLELPTPTKLPHIVGFLTLRNAADGMLHLENFATEASSQGFGKIFLRALVPLFEMFGKSEQRSSNVCALPNLHSSDVAIDHRSQACTLMCKRTTCSAYRS